MIIPISKIIEYVGIEQGKKHVRDKLMAKSGGTYRDIYRLAKKDYEDVSIEDIVDALHVAEDAGLIAGKGFYIKSGRGGAKRWTVIPQSTPEVDK